MSQIRRQVLNIFKKLHRTRQYVFSGDIYALTEGRKEINSHFRKNKDEIDPDEIEQMLQLAKDVEVELRTGVIQAVKKDDNLYQLRITDDTTRLDNVPFNENAVIERPRRKGPKGCLSDADEAEFEAKLAEAKKKCANEKRS